MPSPDESAGLIAKYGGVVLGAAAAGISTVGGWLFKRVIAKHDEEIAGLNAGIKRVEAKVDSKVDQATWEQNRRESRENVIALHSKIDHQASVSEERHRELLNILLEQRGRRRSGD